MDDKIKCALCGKEHNDGAYGTAYREIYVNRDKSLDPGLYRPRLTGVELSRLNGGFFKICVNRAACIKRQLEREERTHEALLRGTNGD